MTQAHFEPPAFNAFRDPNFMPAPHLALSAAYEAEGDGVYRHPFDDAVVATRYVMLEQISRHPAVQAQNRGARGGGPSSGGALARLFDAHPVFNNTPIHKTLHQAAFRTVSPRPPQEISKIASDRALELLSAANERQNFDLVSQFAAEIAVSVWAALIGLTENVEKPMGDAARAIGASLQFQPAPDDLTLADAGAQPLGEIIPAAAPGIEQSQAASAINASAPLIESLRTDTIEITAADLVAAMSFDAIDGAASMTANFLYHILTEDGVWSTVKEDPTLLDAAWTEASRLSPPILGLFRAPVEDVEIEGVGFPAHQNILTLYAAGNRDPAVFDAPHKFRLDRKGARPLSFGLGPRACVGRGLAKVIGLAAAQTLVGRCASISLTDEKLNWGRPGLLRTPRTLPVQLEKETIN